LGIIPSFFLNCFQQGARCGGCGVVDFDNQQGVVILHLLRRGTLRLAHPPAASIELSEPTLLFYRQPFAHRF